MLRLGIVSLAVVVLLVAGCGGDSTDAAATTETTAAFDGCEDVKAPEPRDDGGATAPDADLDPATKPALTFATSCGTFVVTLDVASAPKTTASLVQLAKDGFYDDTVFHRIVPGFVIQGGDPTQSGSGGPGYSTIDPPAPDALYVKGVMAMAKAGAEPSGASGSQFFIVTGADVGLPPEYAVVGSVTEGLDVVEAIGELGDPATEEPLQPVVIDTVTVDELG